MTTPTNPRPMSEIFNTGRPAALPYSAPVSTGTVIRVTITATLTVLATLLVLWLTIGFIVIQFLGQRASDRLQDMRPAGVEGRIDFDQYRGSVDRGPCAGLYGSERADRGC